MIACVKEFESSTDFPSSSSLATQQEALCKDDSQVILKCFKEWLHKNISDHTFNYFYLFITKFGALFIQASPNSEDGKRQGKRSLLDGNVSDVCRNAEEKLQK